MTDWRGKEGFGYTPKIQLALGGNTFNAFVSKNAPVILMRREVKE